MEVIVPGIAQVRMRDDVLISASIFCCKLSLSRASKHFQDPSQLSVTLKVFPDRSTMLKRFSFNPLPNAKEKCFRMQGPVAPIDPLHHILYQYVMHSTFL